MLARLLEERRDLTLLLVRIAFGLIFFVFGWRHVSGLEGFTNAFAERFHIPLAGLTAPLVAWLELLGGTAALLGVFTRYAGGLLAIVMVVSTLTVKLPAGLEKGFDVLGLTGFWDIDLSLFTMGVVLLLMGPGRHSLEQMVLRREI